MQFKKLQQILILPLQVSFIATAVLALSGCAQVPISDEIWYGNKGSLGATELHTLVSTQKDLSAAQWDIILNTQPLICTDVKTFGDIKGQVEKLCSYCNCCDYSTTAALEAFYTKVSQIKVKGN